MGIYSVIVCENCDKVEVYEHTAKKYVVWLGRQDGWSIGKRCLCPNCRRTRKPAMKK